MHRALSLLFLLVTVTQLQAQTQKPASINGDVSHGIITINGTSFTVRSTRTDYEKALGPAARVTKLADKDKFLFYDDLGLSLALRTGSDSVQIARISYSSSDTFRFAKGKYTGLLFVNGISVTEKTNYGEIEKITGSPLLTMPGSNSYLGQGGGLLIILRYASSGISEIGFQFNSDK